MVVTKSQWAQEAHINWELNERISLSSAGSVRNEPSSIRSRSSNASSTRPPLPVKAAKKKNNAPACPDKSNVPVPPPAPDPGTPVQRRWNMTKDRLDRTNDALAKRMSVIQELNRKILVNYDRMHETNRKNRWKPVEQSTAPEDEEKRCKSRADSTKGSLRSRKSMTTVAERRRALGEKMNFQRRAGGEWSLPGVRDNDDATLEKSNVVVKKKIDNKHTKKETSVTSNHQCTLQRGSNHVDRYPGKTTHFPRVLEDLPSAASSPVSWTKVDVEVDLDELKKDNLQNDESSTTQESSVLRELNEAIDRFEEEEDERLLRKQQLNDSTKTTTTSCHDSSWDSGVGADLPVTAKARTGAGWLRVHTGIESSLVYLTLETTAGDVCRDMLLSDSLALFVQYGGESGRRLSSRERPLELQEQLLLDLGYREPSRRARLGLDAELRHLVRFHVGPAAPLDELRGYSRCGHALVLKGLVFPQWKKRALAVVGSRLFLYPACSESRPEWMELAGGGAVCCAPARLGKLVLRVTGFPARITNHQQRESSSTTQQQQQRREGCRETRHLYLGFQHPWDRDLWRGWLKQACQTPPPPQQHHHHHSSSSNISEPNHHPTPTRLDMSNTGISRLPDAVRAYGTGVREFFLGHNQLSRADGNLKILLSFPELQELHLENNRLGELPAELLSLSSLTFLDLSDNEIQRLPAEIKALTSLRELILDRNDIRELPAEIAELRQLQHLSLAANLIELPPAFLLEMRALALTDVLTGRTGEMGAAAKGNSSSAGSNAEEKSNLHNSLYRVNLRNNQLKGNIILGNYGNLTHLDLSENSIEKLDLSALQELRIVRCARNVLTELTLCGQSLVSLIAGNNKLKKLTIVPAPAYLEHLDVSYNELDSLPEWTPDIPELRTLFASHNALTALPDRLLSHPGGSRLEVLHLPHNRLQALPPPRGQLSLGHLTLQDNALTALPVNFFANTLKLKVLNLSNNRLSELPCNYEDHQHHSRCNNRQQQAALEKLYLTGNSLTNTALDALAKFAGLRVLHLAYNALDTLPESCIASWKELEELVLSGNKLQYLPDNVANLPHLKVLRVHSNRLLTCPAFNKTSSLKVLDLAHNHLDRLNLDTLLSAQLQFLDISCNSRLHVDPRQFQSYNSSRRPLSLVDVSGQSRSSSSTSNNSTTASPGPNSNSTTPSRGQHRKDGDQHHLPWRLGFSETAGTLERLLVSQVRMPAFCNTEGLFGLFDGGSNQEAPSSLQEMIPRLLLEERTVKETRSEYLRYTLLSAHRELREKGQKHGVNAALVHITKLQIPQHQSLDVLVEEKPRYLLTAATCGDVKAVLCRASGPLQLAKSASAQYVPRMHCQGGQKGKNLLPIALPEPTSEEVIIEDDDEFVIIGNRHLWEVLSIQEAVREARAEANPVLAAKRLQDLGQAYGAEENLSVIVVRLSTSSALPTPVQPLSRLLMRELRQAVHSKSIAQQQQEAGGVPGNGTCTCPCCMPRLASHDAPAACCCHAAAAHAGLSDAGAVGNGFYLNGVLRNVMSARSSAKSSRSSQRISKDPANIINPQHQQREDRSSPSGQSDQTSEVGLFEPRSRKRTSGRGGGRISSGSASAKVRQQQQQQHQQQQATVMERTPPPSDEQLRCWEYMLEQNTQLLFDKELDTLTSVPRSTALRRGQSRSTPQLGSTSGVPFLSRRFGSARSFDNNSTTGPLQALQPLVQPVPVLRSAFGGSGRRLLNGGPNAAYFGSLQRLMPYNLEYDFAVIQERGALDSLEQDASRMQQYWGVATTEL